MVNRLATFQEICVVREQLGNSISININSDLLQERAQIYGDLCNYSKDNGPLEMRQNSEAAVIEFARRHKITYAESTGWNFYSCTERKKPNIYLIKRAIVNRPGS